jgi:hypothetical protein
MHAGHPQAFDRICRGLFEALRPMVHHLLVPPLLGYAGGQVDRFPAPADCTELGLFDDEFPKDGAYEGDRVWRREITRNGDGSGVGIEAGKRVGRIKPNADTHAHPQERR